MKPASQARTVLCVGDIHGRWAWLASILLYCQPDVCLCAGDFGWFPRLIQPPSLALPREVLGRTEIRFCDGNHEDHASLLASAPRGSFEPVELAPGIVYQPRGSTMDLADGRRVLFAGGAKSVDWRFRTRGRDWFPEEILEPRHLPSPLPQADVVVSHTAPLRFGLDRFGRGCAFGSGFDASPDPSRETLDLVLEGAKPRVWIAGHWHEREDWMLGRLECHVLDMVTGGLCRSAGSPCAFWLAGGPGAGRTKPGWALPGGGFIALRESADGLYACADLAGLRDRKLKAGIAAVAPALQFRSVMADGVRGVRPGDIDRMLEFPGRTGWLT